MLKKLLLLVFIISCRNILFAQEVSLFKQFYGHYDFTMIGNTLNLQANGPNVDCEILTQSSADLNLNTNEKIVAAYLYWAGNGLKDEMDLNVKLNNIPLTSQRTFNEIYGDESNRSGYYSAFTDVTDLIKRTGNGNYLFSDFDRTKIIPQYCKGFVNFGGWAIIIVFENPSLPKNTVTIYDGFKGILTSSSIEFNLEGFKVTDTKDSKIGFLVWEGDIMSANESLKINNQVVSNEINPPGNPFNSTNSFTNRTDLWNMDLDYFMLEDYISEGDSSLNIKIATSQDIVFVNAVALTIGSLLPDATILLNKIEFPCFSRTIEVNYTVFNTEAEHILIKDTPIAFYVNNELVGTDKTKTDIQIGENKSQTTTLVIPVKHGMKFDIKAVIDDDGTGKGRIFEINENNNTNNISADLLKDCSLPKGVSPNNDGINDVLDLSYIDITELKIFNRNGTMVYNHGEGYTNQWHGQNKNGKQLPTGTYFYVIKTKFDTYSSYVYLMNESK